MQSLLDLNGKRKYLTKAERNAFLCAANKSSPEIATFCAVLAYTGARISEVLALTPDRVDVDAGVIVFETLKKRRRGIYRAVPVPGNFLVQLLAVHDIRALQSHPERKDQRLWPWSRTKAWMVVKRVMCAAGITGAQASPKGLRHALGVNALQSSVPLNLVSRWLGHSRLSTTAIYTDATGDEEREIAESFWATF